jgi:hypothetical protein
MAKSRPYSPPSTLSERLTNGVLGWLIPGLGYWFLGFPVRALCLGGSLLALFWVGESLLAGDMAVSREVHPYFFVGQAGNGLSAFLADHFWGTAHDLGPRAPIDRNLPPHLNLGILCTIVSGLLNVLLVLHCLDPRSYEKPDVSQASDPSGAAS